jgi:hypothetical protein
MIVVIVGIICFLLGAVAGGVVTHYKNLRRLSSLAKIVKRLLAANNQERAIRLLSTFELE